MTFEQLLLAAVEQRLLRPLDVQFARMVAQNDPPAVMLAAAARFVGGELRRCSGADDFVRRPALSEPDVAQRADRRPLL